MTIVENIPVWRHTPHLPLDFREGHPILTPLRAANDHIRAALAHPRRVGINREKLAQEIAALRAGLDVLESDYAGGFFQ